LTSSVKANEATTQSAVTAFLMVRSEPASIADSHLGEDFLGVSKTVETGRHPTIDGDLQKDFAQFFLGDALLSAPRMCSSIHAAG